VEVTGFDADAFCPADMLARIAAIFRPGSLSASLSVDAASRCGGYAWGSLAAPPPGYGVQSATAQELATGGRVSYYTFGPDPAAGAPAGVDDAASSRCSSPGLAAAAPRGVLRHMPSFSSAPSSSFDSGSSCDDRSIASGDEGEGAATGAGKAAAAAAARAWAKGLALSMKRVRFEDDESGGAASSGAASDLGSPVAAGAAVV
jgi:hypothetical protein